MDAKQQYRTDITETREDESWIPSLKEYPAPFSAEEWKTLLQNKKVFTENALLFVQRLYIAKEATCTELAEKYGESYNFYNTNNWNLGERIYKETNCSLSSRNEGGNRFWSVCCLGKEQEREKSGTWLFKLRPELIQAIEELGMTNPADFESRNNFLQKIYDNHWEYDDWFKSYETNVTEFLKQGKTGEWNDSTFENLIKNVDNGISSLKQGGFFYDEYEQIKENWAEIQSVISKIATENNITSEEYTQIKNFLLRYATQNKTAATNRVIAAFLPNIVTTTIKEDYFYFVINNLKNKCKDYPEIKNNWLEDNKEFIKYCNNVVDFKHPWHSSLFCWCLKEYFEIDKENTMTNPTELYAEEIALLKNNYNIIFHGAPGTGKTFMAKEIAKAMGCTENEIGFVQFHPSYDYTDFVEGLRPCESENGQVGFERKDGVFKDFCRRALKNLQEDYISNFDELYNAFVESLLENPITLKTPVQKKEFDLEINGNRNIYAIPKTQVGTKMLITKSMLQAYVEENIIRDWKPYTTAIGDYFKSFYDIKKVHIAEEKKSFVFIIDEINRGEMSKIFGELFYSIDPGYRGTDGKVKTQYANMLSEPNEFDVSLKKTNDFGWFYVPENVYIIGTMNDIDRSVESMDFAMRRRFIFKEVTATQSAKNMKLSLEAKNRMDAINKEISKIEELGSSYHIGGSYFLKKDDATGEKLSLSTDKEFEELWNYKLSSLIKEYLRGIDDENNSKFNAIKDAYENPQKSTSEDSE